MADGTKLPCMVIFKGLTNVPKGRFPNDVIVEVNEKGFMTAEMLNKWKQCVWKTRPGGFFRPSSLIVFDSATSHLKRTTISSFKQHYNTEVAIIPGGMTPLLQPADVHWNKPFKSAMRDKWLQWLSEGEEEYTASGKRKSASYEMVVNWVSECWKAIPIELIQKSFVQCGMPWSSPDQLHERLRCLLADEQFEQAEEHTGLTDEEDDEDRENQTL